MVEYRYLLAPLIGWLVAQGVKFIISLRKNGLQLSDFTSSGGMPSSHSAATSALATLIGLEFGFDSAIFALSATLSAIVMYDAQDVRRSVGNIADFILKNDDKKAKGQILATHGHSGLEVIVGGITGIAVGFSIYSLL